MPRNRNPGHDPDDRKESERTISVGRRDPRDEVEHEDIEAGRSKQRRDASDESDDETIAEYEVDLDAAPDGDGPDA